IIGVPMAITPASNLMKAVRLSVRAGTSLVALVALFAGTSAAQLRPAENPVSIWVDRSSGASGNGARVYVRMSEDGYALVLKGDAVGNIRVLFPLDPTDDNFLRGGQSYELKGNNDQPALTSHEPNGPGVVLAVRSDQPFRFDRLAQGHEWNQSLLNG